MNESQDNELDRLLCDWSESRAVDADELAALRQRVDERLASESRQAVVVERLPRQTDRSKWRVPAVLAMAATVLVALAAWSRYLAPKNVGDQVAQRTQDEQPAIPGLRLGDKKQLLAECRELFGTQFAWLVEQPNRAEVGLHSSDFAEPSTSDEYVVVRLVLVARRTGGSDWNEVQNLNVVVQREELVEVLSDTDSSASLVMWAYPLDDEMISIDLRYEPSKFADRLPMVEGLSIESSGVQRLGKSTRIQSFVRGDVEYRLYQSADVIDGNDVG